MHCRVVRIESTLLQIQGGKECAPHSTPHVVLQGHQAGEHAAGQLREGAQPAHKAVRFWLLHQRGKQVSPRLLWAHRAIQVSNQRPGHLPRDTAALSDHFHTPHVSLQSLVSGSPQTQLTAAVVKPPLACQCTDFRITVWLGCQRALPIAAQEMLKSRQYNATLADI